MTIRSRTLLPLVVLLAAVAPARAGFTITQDTNAASLTNALVGGAGLTVNSTTLDARTTGAAASSGRYTLTPGPTPYGITSSGIILSTGDVSAYAPGANTSTNTSTNYGVAANAAQAALLTQVGGAGNYFDVTQLTINFTLAADSDRLFFDVVFGSEEFPEFTNSNFIDGFGLFVNGTNIATVGGQPVNINNPAFAAVAGTQLDGVLAPGGNPVVRFSSVVGFGATGTLTFIIADKVDGGFDTTAYISGLSGGDVTGPDLAIATPAPAGLLVALAAAGLLAAARRRVSRG